MKRLSLLLLVLFTMQPATADDLADTVLLNAQIYTVDGQQPWAEALAVRSNLLVHVGNQAEVQPWVGPNTQVIDLGGRVVLPGLHDSHIHLLEAHHPAGGRCALPPGLLPEDYLPIVQECSNRADAGDWVLGFGHSILDLAYHLDFGGRPPIEILDQAAPFHPTAFLEETSHSVWANSLALAAAGIDAQTPDPPGGAILRDPDTGEPNGILLDSAGEMVMDSAFQPTAALQEQNYQALLDGLENVARNGITSVADARVYWRRGYLEAWQRARDEGRLTVRAVLGLWAYPYDEDDDAQIATLKSMFSNDPDSHLRASQIKIYSDGEMTHTTAALLEPYLCCRLVGPLGLEYFSPPRLEHYVRELEAAGFDFHIHAIGDRGVRNALDVLAAVQSSRAEGLAPRHRLTHLEMLHPEDIPRFNTLNVIADFQMSSEFVEPPNTQDNVPLLGQERVDERLWRLRDVYESGARVVLSSDYDVGDLSPFRGMQRSLTRGDQSLPDLDAAIRAYTIDAAYLMRQEDRVGSLEVGKRADFIVLDRNPFSLPAEQIGTTQVDMTFLDGQMVWPAVDAGEIFSDGFESGDTSRWSVSP